MTIRSPGTSRLPITTIEHLGAFGISWRVNHQFQGIHYINSVESTCTLDFTSSNIKSTLTWQWRSAFSPLPQTKLVRTSSSPRVWWLGSHFTTSQESRNIPPQWLQPNFPSIVGLFSAALSLSMAITHNRVIRLLSWCHASKMFGDRRYIHWFLELIIIDGIRVRSVSHKKWLAFKEGARILERSQTESGF
jgi:hypothetical protein